MKSLIRSFAFAALLVGAQAGWSQSTLDPTFIPNPKDVPRSVEGFGPVTGPGVKGADRPIFLGSVGSPSIPESLRNGPNRLYTTPYGAEGRYSFLMAFWILSVVGVPLAVLYLAVRGRMGSVTETVAGVGAGAIVEEREEEKRRAA